MFNRKNNFGMLQKNIYIYITHTHKVMLQLTKSLMICTEKTKFELHRKKNIICHKFIIHCPFHKVLTVIQEKMLKSCIYRISPLFLISVAEALKIPRD